MSPRRLRENRHVRTAEPRSPMDLGLRSRYPELVVLAAERSGVRVREEPSLFRYFPSTRRSNRKDRKSKSPPKSNFPNASCDVPYFPIAFNPIISDTNVVVTCRVV